MPIVCNISNPSDPYTIEAVDAEVAAAACLLIGGGAYALESEDGKMVLPFFFGATIADVNKFFIATYGKQYKIIMDSRALDIASALDNILIGNFRDRELVKLATSFMSEENAKLYMDVYHDKKRSSENDIARSGSRIATSIRGDINRSKAEANHG